MKSTNRRSGRGWETLLAVAAALAAGGAGGYLIATRAESSTPDTTAPAGRPEKVTALGRLQPAKGVVPVYGPPGDRIGKMYPVAVGNELKAGAPIAELASRPERLREVQIAELQFTESQTTLAAAKRAGEQKILAATAELNQAKANKESDLAALDAREKFVGVQVRATGRQVARLAKLRADGVRVADEDYEKAELAKAQADAELSAAKATVEKTRVTYEQSEKAAAAKIEAARAELDEAVARVPLKSSEERVALANQVAELTVIKAPVAGTILKVIGRAGQPTGVEPILQLADLSGMTVVAEVYESDVGRISEWVGKGPVRAAVSNPALPKPLAGVVNSDQDISRMIARNQVFAMGPREDADRRVVEVTVHLDAEAAKEAGRFVGLQVTVTLEPNK